MPFLLSSATAVAGFVAGLKLGALVVIAPAVAKKLKERKDG